MHITLRKSLVQVFALFIVGLVLTMAPMSAQAQTNALEKSIAANAAGANKTILAFYKSRAFKPIWMGNKDSRRRKAFLDALKKAPDHGLPKGRYDFAKARKNLTGMKSVKARGAIEIETTRMFLQYARDVRSGILEPRRIDENMTLKPPRRNQHDTLVSLAKSSPPAFFKALPPKHPDYQRLLKEKVRMEKVVGRGGWGPKVKAKKLEPGQSGAPIAAMRKRLTAMGYKNLGNSASYDAKLEHTVKLFQQDHGLNPDGRAGGVTIAALNTSAKDRLMQVVIGLERLRWLNKPLGKRHILVNEAGFTATVFDNGSPTFTTRVVVGLPGRWRTPEFERKMTHMIINPSWYVPESIAGTEYLPLLKEDASTLSRQGIVMTNAEGQAVDPTKIDYTEFDKDNFPFSLRQPPSDANALGNVKFMFPNKHAIYLHDTPSKSLFGRDLRAFSHGCVRVQKPTELAYTLLGKQSSNPKNIYDRYLADGEEVTVTLKDPVPIYLVYRTAWVSSKGRPNYRADTYKVDKKVFAALSKAGVVLRSVKN